MGLDIKICGVTSPDALAAVVASGADMVGFVIFGPSPRNIAPAAAGALARHLPARLRTVALTVDADDALLDEIMAGLDPSMIQAHGSETPQRVAEIAARTGRPVMKAIALAEEADLAAVRPFEAVAERILFDARPPQGADRPGGHGAAFDWRLARAYRGPARWMLSGGLTPDTVGAAIALSGAPGVDVSSGVERERGVKEPGLIAAFVAAARRAERELEERP